MFLKVQVFQGPGFSRSRFFRVQVFQGSDFSGSRFLGSRSRVRVQSPESGFIVQVQVIERAMRNIFLENSYTKCGAETSLRPFPEKWKLSTSLDQLAKVSYSLFLLYAKLRAIEIYWNYAADHWHLSHSKLFLITKRGLGLVSLTYFLHDFWRKLFLLIYSINKSSFIVWLFHLLWEILYNMCIVDVC